jgi:xylulokinase
LSSRPDDTGPGSARPGQPDGAGRTHSVLGIDLGTSSVKVIVAGPDGQPLAMATAEYPVVAAQPGQAESDPAAWWAAVMAAVRQAAGSAGTSPSAIGLSGQMHGLVLTGPGGEVLRPALLWADGRAAPCLAAYRRLGPAALARLANPLTPGMAGPLLLWVAEHEPLVYQRARWALQPKDWLRQRLTGRAQAEPSDASATLLYDLPADRWDSATVAGLGLSADLLAPLLPGSAQLAGTLTAEAAAELGLPAGLPVAAGAADTAAAAFGTGMSHPGEVQLTIGTGAQLVTPRDSPAARPETGTHLYRSAGPGWYAMAATLSAGIALNWVRSTLGASWAQLYDAASELPRPGDPVFLPHLPGERTPYLDPQMRGAWTGLGLGHTRTDLLRAALEGVAFAIRDALDALPGADSAAAVRLAGGGTAAQPWRQMLADILRLPLQAVDVPAASARGAALLGACAISLLTPADVYGPLAPAARQVAEPDPASMERFAVRRQSFLHALHQLRCRTGPAA